jgi:hypothetical protein
MRLYAARQTERGAIYKDECLTAKICSQMLLVPFGSICRMERGLLDHRGIHDEI